MSEVNHGIINLPSPYSVAETMDRLERLLKAKGIKVFLRIDQQQEARQAGLDMRPTELLLFGNPQAGTPIMNAAPSVGAGFTAQGAGMGR